MTASEPVCPVHATAYGQSHWHCSHTLIGLYWTSASYFNSLVYNDLMVIDLLRVIDATEWIMLFCIILLLHSVWLYLCISRFCNKGANTCAATCGICTPIWLLWQPNLYFHISPLFFIKLLSLNTYARFWTYPTCDWHGCPWEKLTKYIMVFLCALLFVNDHERSHNIGTKFADDHYTTVNQSTAGHFNLRILWTAYKCTVSMQL